MTTSIPVTIKSSIPIAIKSRQEPITIVLLEDGTRIEARIVIMSVRRNVNDDGKPECNPDGSPSFTINHAVSLVAIEGEVQKLSS